MMVSEDEITVGKCYVTPHDHVRRVLRFDALGRVVYESRGRKAQRRPWGATFTVDRATFAAAVEREVSCDYDPAYPEKTL